MKGRGECIMDTTYNVWYLTIKIIMQDKCVADLTMKIKWRSNGLHILRKQNKVMEKLMYTNFIQPGTCSNCRIHPKAPKPGIFYFNPSSHFFSSIAGITGWWLSSTPKNDGVRQLGLWHYQLNGKTNVPNHQPDQYVFSWFHHSTVRGTPMVWPCLSHLPSRSPHAEGVDPKPVRRAARSDETTTRRCLPKRWLWINQHRSRLLPSGYD
jgi:hypothetical protein